ncbi:SGNH/GDSL hydrolase family protein [Paraburkholderia acidiphila]|uniref:Acylhydrolase n=1 Tax=Paraburkholderia acidiphila TaxID=2571747 RepID=A0A7Z2G5A9_9BURK|nr:SGNH/GDSL hydrolase family protein [Paraburkholderia acidiphila]QGZ55497.1 acylhydrolase [Paraburkholderia acidiphila]
MKHQGPRHRTLLRATQIAVASAAFALLAACGGSSGGGSNNASTPPGGVNLQVVSFGDSLSDVGTYAKNILPEFGGGRFTTNPGEIWTQKIAEYYGGTLTPAYQGGFGAALTATGGMGYAQGGANVSASYPEGEGWAPGNAAATTVPVATQVSQYLSANKSFNANQLVLIDGGANDIFAFATTANLTALGAQLTAAATAAAQAGTPLTQVQQVEFIANYLLTNSSGAQIAASATALATQVGTILAAGGKHVVLMTVPDIGQTPLGVEANAGTPGAAALLTGISAAYNAIVSGALTQAGIANDVIVADAFAWFDQLLPAYQANGFTVSNTGTACNLTQMQASATAYAQQNPSVLAGGMTAAQYGAQFASSLFCSPQSYTVANADQTYIFADSVHPTTHTHALFAQYVEGLVAKSGVGK